MDSVFGASSSTAGTSAWQCNSHGSYGARGTHVVQILRPLLPQSGLFADRGLWQSCSSAAARKARKDGNSVFVDNDFKPFADQWTYLQEMEKMSPGAVERLVSRYDKEPLGELSKSSESAPWERPLPKPMTQTDFPKRITIIRSSGIYILTKRLSAKAVNHLKRLAAFKNPEFYVKLGMRLPVYNLPRIISCSEITDDYLILPRGCEVCLIFSQRK